MFARPTVLLVTLFYSFIFCKADAQIILNTSSADYSLANLVQQYTDNRGRSLLLYNGIEYAFSYPRTTGYPFFLTDTFQNSSIVYDDGLYRDVPLAYDIVNNVVVIKNTDRFPIQLASEKITSFLFKSHFFAALTPAILKTDVLQPGIYEVYDYHTAVIFIRHQKVVQRASNAADPDHFTDYDLYFVKLNDKYFTVKNNDALLTIFSDRSNEIKAYQHQNHISFKKHPEDALLKTAAYYAQIKK